MIRKLARRGLMLMAIGAAILSGSFLHPVVAGQPGTYLGESVGTGLVELAAAAGVVAIVAGVGSVLTTDHLRAAASKQGLRRGARVVGAFLVVSSMIVATPGMVGPAAAASGSSFYGFQDCDPSDSLVGAFLNSFTSPNAAGECRFNPTDPEPDYNNVSSTDAYAAGLAMNDTTETFISQTRNTNEMLNDTAWLEAKMAIIRAYRNNSTEAEAIAKAKNASHEPIAATQENILRDYSRRSDHIAYLVNVGDVKRGDSTAMKNWTQNFWFVLADGRNESFRVPVYDTGTMVKYEIPIAQSNSLTDFNGESFNSSRVTYNTTNVDAWDAPSASAGTNNWYAYSFTVGDSDSTDRTNALDLREYRDEMLRTLVIRNRIDSNIEAYVNETYPKLESGEINVSDIVANSPTTMASQASSEWNSTGYHSYAATSIASLGIDGNLTASHTIETTQVRANYSNGSRSYDNRTVEIDGTLLYTGDDGPTLQTGETYNPENFSGEFLVTVSEMRENGSEVNYSNAYFRVRENFTIKNATNTNTGEPVNQTTMEVRDYSSTNVSDLPQELEQAQQTREYYNNLALGGGGGGFFDSDGDGKPDFVPVALAIGAVLVVVSLIGGDGSTLNISR
jgi:hypothetical protein